MGSLVERDRMIARKKGITAGAVTVGAVALMTMAWPLGLVAMVPAGFLVKDWFMYRARRGMRF